MQTTGFDVNDPKAMERYRKLADAAWAGEDIDDVDLEEVDAKHLGPGDHPSGSPQDVHAGDSPTSDQTDTEAFKKWFGDSVVVDGDGKPLVVYHGTKSQFDEFEDTDNGLFYFVTDKEVASKYGHELKPVFLSLQNPFDFDPNGDAMGMDRVDTGENWRSFFSEMNPELSLSIDEDDADTSMELFEFMNRSNIVSEIQAAGYDGAFGYEHNRNIYMVFKSTQIKSATRNQGTFDPTDPDITKHLGPGDHPSGSSQDVHGSGDGGDVDSGGGGGEYRKLIDDFIDDPSQKWTLPNNSHVRVTIFGNIRKDLDRDEVASWLEELDSFNLPEDVVGEVVLMSDDDIALITGSMSAPLGAYNLGDKQVLYNYDGLLDYPFEKTSFHMAQQPLDVIAHEAGHVLHGGSGFFNAIRGMRRKFSNDPALSEKLRQRVRQEVSPYASTMPIEFVAEVFTGMRQGKTFSDDIMELYGKMRGPKVQPRK